MHRRWWSLTHPVQVHTGCSEGHCSAELPSAERPPLPRPARLGGDAFLGSAGEEEHTRPRPRRSPRDAQASSRSRPHLSRGSGPETDAASGSSQESKSKRADCPPKPIFPRYHIVFGDAESLERCETACPGAERGCSTPGVPRARGWLRPSSPGESFRCLAGNKPKQLLKLLASPSGRYGVLTLDALICQHLPVKLSLSVRRSAWISCLKERGGGGKRFLQQNEPHRGLLPIFPNDGPFPSIYQPAASA